MLDAHTKHIMLAETRNWERRSGGVTSDDGPYSLYISWIPLTSDRQFGIMLQIDKRPGE
jgi:hypothetical protein